MDPSKDAKMDRRDILSLSATTVVGLIFPLKHIFAQVPASESEMKILSDYMSAAGNRALPAEAAEQAKHHLLDTLSSMISGSELPPGQAALRYIGSHAGKGSATIVGSAVTATPIDAALANGVMAHADETDDSHNASRSPGLRCCTGSACRRRAIRHRRRSVPSRRDAWL